MTTPKSRTWPLAEARGVAEGLLTLLRSACERIEVAGSVRRQRPQVGDIELLAVSKVSPANQQMTFDRPRRIAQVTRYLDHRVGELIAKGTFDYRLNKLGRRAFGPKNKMLIHVPSGISVDLFSTTAENWGMSLLVRTGSADYCVKVMSRLIALGHRGHAYGGITLQSGEEINCPTEEEVFRILQWPFVAPEQRV